MARITSARIVVGLAVALAAGADVACNGTPSAPAPSKRSEPEQQQPPCTRILHLGPVGRPVPLGDTRIVGINGFRWLDEYTLIVLVDEGDITVRGDGLPRGDDDRLGVLFYDLRHTYQTDFGADYNPQPGVPADYSPMGSFPVRATQFDLLRGKRTLLLAGETGVATLEIDSGCLRSSRGLVPAVDRQSGVPQTLSAIDNVHGRFFFVSGHRLVRVDADRMDAPFDAPLHDDVSKIAYDAVSDRVVTRTPRGVVQTYDASTLAALPALPVRRITGGPWVRPGHAQAMVTYYVKPPPCQHPDPHASPYSMFRPKCLDPVPADALSPHRLALIDLTTGAELRVGNAGTQNTDWGTWSTNGDLFLFESATVWQEGDDRPHRLPYGIEGMFTELDATGQSFAHETGGMIAVGDVATGKHRWMVIGPRPHTAERPRSP